MLTQLKPAKRYRKHNKKIVVINLLGEIVLQKFFGTITEGKVELDVSFLSPGIYFIKAGNESDSYRIRKFVKE